MWADISEVVKRWPAAAALLTSPDEEFRLYAFGNAPQNVTTPYATWQTRDGSRPENILNGRPLVDNLELQFDLYADDRDGCLALAAAVRDAVELDAHVESFMGMGFDKDTKLFRFTLVLNWIINR